MTSAPERPDAPGPADQAILRGDQARETADDRRQEARTLRGRSQEIRAQSEEILARSEEALGAAATALVERLVHEVEGLYEALDSRTVIANAVGLMMAREAVTREGGFDVLRRISQRTNRKLRDVAAEVVDDHERQVRNEGDPAADVVPG